MEVTVKRREVVVTEGKLKIVADPSLFRAGIVSFELSEKVIVAP